MPRREIEPTADKTQKADPNASGAFRFDRDFVFISHWVGKGLIRDTTLKAEEGSL